MDEVIWESGSGEKSYGVSTVLTQKRPDGERLAAAFYLFVAPPLVVEQVASKANPVFDTPASIEMAGRLRSQLPGLIRLEVALGPQHL